MKNDPESCRVNLLGTLRGDPTQDKAIAILSKTEFPVDQVQYLGKQNPVTNKRVKATDMEEYFHNDMFRKYWVNLDKTISKI